MNSIIDDIFPSDILNWNWIYGVTAWSSVEYPPLGVIIYLLILFLLHRWMQTRPPIRSIVLDKLLVLHNLFLWVLSVGMCVGFLVGLILRLKVGDYDLLCDVAGNNSSGLLWWISYIFYLSKFYELFDTIFIILKKNPLIFLHVWHHATVIFVCWVGITSTTTFTWMGGFTNSFVHSFMYYYYAVRANGGTVWWKKYMTTLQLVQFMFNISVLIYWFYLYFSYQYNNQPTCSGSLPGVLFVTAINVSYFFLFRKFYQDTYTNKKAD